MGNYDSSDWEEYGRFKTVRQKKRLLKEDRNKQLIQVNKNRDELWKQIRALPPVPLEVPYQRGWLRTFELRWDVAISKDAEFFQTLLNKINTVQYSHKKKFQIKKRQRGKKIYINKPQYLVMIHACEWKRNTIKNWQGQEVTFNEKEKSYFSIKELEHPSGHLVYVYYFNEQWRFVQKVKPNIITHAKMNDRELLSKLQKLENHVRQHNLSHRIRKILYGCAKIWYYRKKQKDDFLNIGLHQLLEQACDGVPIIGDEYINQFEYGN